MDRKRNGGGPLLRERRRGSAFCSRSDSNHRRGIGVLPIHQWEKTSGSEINYTVKQVLHVPQLTMAPINVFTTTNQIDEIFLTSTFCNGRRPDPTSIYALEEKCNGFRANSPYKEVRRLELTHLEDTDSWVLHLKPARLNHRYSIKWKWEKSNVRDRDSSIPDLS